MSIMHSFNNGHVVLENDPVINEKNLVELSVGDIVEYKTRTLQVIENDVPLSCAGCVVKDFFVGHESNICDGLACFRAYRKDGKNIKLKLTNKKLLNRVTGGGQQSLSL